jgi:branched-chain amino acid transport system permease protein
MFRLRGHYFCIGTWVVAEVFRLVASQLSLLGGGSASACGWHGVAMAPSRQMREFLIYWIALALWSRCWVPSCCCCARAMAWR